MPSFHANKVALLSMSMSERKGKTKKPGLEVHNPKSLSLAEEYFLHE